MKVSEIGSSDYNKVERTLRALKETHQTILEGIEEGYVEVDLRGDVVFCNDSYSKIIGYPMEGIVGLNYREYMTGSVAKQVFAAYNRVFNTGVPNKGFNYEIITKNGDKRIIENSISLIKDSKGRRVGFRSVTRDITDRKQAEEELERHRSYLQAIFESAKDAIITFDSDKIIVEANTAAENICCLAEKKNIGQALSYCSTHCDKTCLDIIKEALSNKTAIKECEIRCNHYERPQQRVIITGSRLLSPKDEFMGIVVFVRDITRLTNLEEELRERHHFQKIFGKSDKMQDIYELLSGLADLETTVLITGESGTGKSLVAKALHYSGNRAFKPVITVNCSALPESLLESELFGHVKGSFTGAIKDTQGRFQTAAGGTIILDEIGDVSPRIQLKLLRVLEEEEYERVGESVPMKTNVRVIACTNRDLKEKVRLGEFREDLYYRLKVVEVEMPSLRERTEDIPLLVDHFLSIFSKNFSKNIQGISDEVLEAFMNYAWPGNIRELRHSIEHAFVLCHGPQIYLGHLPAEIRGCHGCERWAVKKRPADEQEEILAVLHKTYWNKAKAARLLGID
ncbi:MAG: sigma 54-interacting transcriptional regulator [Syntrophales bacterium]|nr:sigma 54-interacting transcriptional regulator [Syntrophales bacterium]MDY0044109.1 sigma 54-interacting transcriptional regulator [Syntrophales bacterium]